MIEINFSRQAVKFLENAHPKHSKQIARKLSDLRNEPISHDSSQLKGQYAKYILKANGNTNLFLNGEGAQRTEEYVSTRIHDKNKDSIFIGKEYRRADIGEYRIIYFVEGEVLYIVLIGKRNDSEIYKILKRS